jgi:hypothetical protein
MGKTEMQEKSITEALTPQQRMKLKQALRRNKAKIALGRKRAMRRVATGDVLKKRAQRAARKKILNLILKNRNKQDLSYSQRANIEKQVKKRGAAIQRIAKRLLPVVRQKDRQKFRNKGEK